MQASGPDWETILHLAITLARDAGAELRRRFGRQLTVTLKDELDPVTDADQAAETLIRQGIQTYFPMHAIQGEEQGETTPEGPLRWLVDPLDGTVEFISIVVCCASLRGRHSIPQSWLFRIAMSGSNGGVKRHKGPARVCHRMPEGTAVPCPRAAPLPRSAGAPHGPQPPRRPQAAPRQTVPAPAGAGTAGARSAPRAQGGRGPAPDWPSPGPARRPGSRARRALPQPPDAPWHAERGAVAGPGWLAHARRVGSWAGRGHAWGRAPVRSAAAPRASWARPKPSRAAPLAGALGLGGRGGLPGWCAGTGGLSAVGF